MNITSFIENQCKLSPSSSIPKVSLYVAYRQYAGDQLDRREFDAQILSLLGITDAERGWLGIELLRPDFDVEEDHSGDYIIPCLENIGTKIETLSQNKETDLHTIMKGIYYLSQMLVALGKLNTRNASSIINSVHSATED